MPSSGLNRFFYFFLSISLIFLAISKQLEEGDEEEKIVTVTFDISDSKIQIPEDSDLVEKFTAKPGERFFTPSAKLKKSGFTFMGWTADGIYGFEPNDVYVVGNDDMIFTPCFVDSNDKTFYKVEYHAELDGEVYDTSDIITTGKFKKNHIVMPDLTNLFCEKAKHYGWQFEGHKFLPYQKFVMPAKNVVMEPIWHRYHVLTYYTGDVDGIIGATKAAFDLEEGGKKELATANRFARKGYNVIGWHNEYDGKDYKFLESYVMPDSDVDFYAIWEPINYTIVFSAGVTGIQSIKIKGETGTTIIVPEMEGENEGFTFGGWSYEGKIYLPGDEFLVEGAAPGVGISLRAVWNKNSE